jgi:hypothetical protein
LLINEKILEGKKIIITTSSDEDDSLDTNNNNNNNNNKKRKLEDTLFPPEKDIIDKNEAGDWFKNLDDKILIIILYISYNETKMKLNNTIMNLNNTLNTAN